MSNISGTRSGFFTGKRWTLHQTKADETTPGPKYNPEQITGVDFKNRFARGRSEVKIIPVKGTERTEYCREAPGHEYDLQDYWKRDDSTKKDRARTVVKGFKIPGEKRLQSTPKKMFETPGANQYGNTNEIVNKVVHKTQGGYTIGKHDRKTDFVKFSSMHNELVEKGYY